MSIVSFSFNSVNIDIPCSNDEKFKSINQRFKSKLDEKVGEILLVYNAKYIKEEQTFNEIANKIDKERKKMNVIVWRMDEERKKDKFIISKDIICQNCYENSFINIKAYKFNIKCKNGHKLENVSIKEFDEKQKIDISKYSCHQCNRNRTEIFENNFYICGTCNSYLCPLCKMNHNKKHKIIDFDNKYYLCNKHYFSFIKYCNYCGSNICMQCQSEHKGHNYIDFGDLFIDKEKIGEEMVNFKETINKYIEDLKNKMLNIINDVEEKMEIYYKIFDKIINNYEIQKLIY